MDWQNSTVRSAAPLADIEAYLAEIGATRVSELAYEHDGLAIRIEVGINETLKRFSVPQHTINVQGSCASLNKFLNDFRLKFLTAGG